MASRKKTTKKASRPAAKKKPAKKLAVIGEVTADLKPGVVLYVPIKRRPIGKCHLVGTGTQNMVIKEAARFQGYSGLRLHLYHDSPKCEKGGFLICDEG